MSLVNKNVFRRFFLKVKITADRKGGPRLPYVHFTAIDMPVTGITYDTIPIVRDKNEGNEVMHDTSFRVAREQRSFDGSCFSHSFNHVTLTGVGYSAQVHAQQVEAHQDRMHDKSYVPEFFVDAYQDPMGGTLVPIADASVEVVASVLIDHRYATSVTSFDPGPDEAKNKQFVVFFDAEHLNSGRPIVIHRPDELEDTLSYRGDIIVDSKVFRIEQEFDRDYGAVSACYPSPSVDFLYAIDQPRGIRLHVESAGPMWTWDFALLRQTNCESAEPPQPSGCCEGAVQDDTVRELVEQIKLSNVISIIAMDTTIHPTARHLAALKALDSINIKGDLTSKNVAQFSLTSLVASAIASTSNQAPYMRKDPAKDNKPYIESPDKRMNDVNTGII